MELSPYARLNHACLLTLTFIAVTVALSLTKTVLVPFVFAILIYEAMLPLVDFLEKKFKGKRNLAALLAILIFTLVFILLIGFVLNSVQQFLNDAQTYKLKLQDFGNLVVETANQMGFVNDKESVQKTIRELPIFSFAGKFAGGALGFIGNFTLVGIFVVFMLMGNSFDIPKDHILNEINAKISKYLSTKLLTSLITAVLVGLVLYFFNSDLVLVFAILTFLLNFIPSFGSIIATAMLVPILFLKLGLGPQFIICIGLCGLIQFSIGNIIEPKIMGENMELHPITILVFLLFWGLVWGVPGMFLAVPITATLKIVLSRVPSTQGLALLLAGKLSSNK
ncbi:MAG: AI-2E family transporter [Bdellovibrionales bacterium]